MEWGTISGGGHVLIYGFDSLIGWDSVSNLPNYDIYVAKTDYETLFQKVADNTDAFAILAHPSSSHYDGLFTNDRDSVRDNAIVGVAYRSGPAFSTDTTYTNPSSSSYNARYKDLLKRGYHVGPTMDHDNHYTTFGRTTPARLVVMADTLSQDAILDALRESRFYTSDDWNVEVTFSCNGSVMGENVIELTDPSFSVFIYDPDSSDAIDYIRLRYGEPGSGSNSTILSSTSNDSLNYTHSISLEDTFYYYLEIRQIDDDRIVTAPIRFIKDNPPILPIGITKFIAEDMGTMVRLSWKVGSSLPVGHFILDKAGEQDHWARVAEVPGIPGLSEYHFDDLFPMEGTSFYQLSAFTTEDYLLGEKTISFQRSIKREATINIYPNPNDGQLMVVYISPGASTVTLELIDLLGRRHGVYEYEAAEGYNRWDIKEPDMIPGAYTILATSKHGIVTVRVMKN
ncbi:MAG: T9SS type A sorting domain-containing protein, partial [Bacteroidetes bacterium]|nr:T9SS type A sorting domain-containing protein [Bacteroidota bacterium]